MSAGTEMYSNREVIAFSITTSGSFEAAAGGVTTYNAPMFGGD